MLSYLKRLFKCKKHEMELRKLVNDLLKVNRCVMAGKTKTGMYLVASKPIYQIQIEHILAENDF